MKSSFFLLIAFAMFTSCGNNDSSKDATTTSENEDDAARNFIRSVLDQDFDKARTMIVNDSLNNSFLNLTERSFNKMSKQDKYNYKNASIQNYNTRLVNDSTMIVYYANSFKRKDDSLKLVKQQGQWLVDLKYTFPSTKDVNAQ